MGSIEKKDLLIKVNLLIDMARQEVLYLLIF